MTCDLIADDLNRDMDPEASHALETDGPGWRPGHGLIQAQGSENEALRERNVPWQPRPARTSPLELGGAKRPQPRNLSPLSKEEVACFRIWTLDRAWNAGAKHLRKLGTVIPGVMHLPNTHTTLGCTGKERDSPKIRIGYRNNGFSSTEESSEPLPHRSSLVCLADRGVSRRRCALHEDKWFQCARFR